MIFLETILDKWSNGLVVKALDSQSRDQKLHDHSIKKPCGDLIYIYKFHYIF